MLTFALWLSIEFARLTAHPTPPPPTASIPRGEVPRNVRPWTPPAATTQPDPCGPPVPKEKK